ncbi:DUF3108 domain-containing protein [Gammaproteobacteria bacterium]|nr:DUF3108 domain-containing protein [Gammaproteobacteria bacterium]MDB9859714.1 DUF3108 domain-containing protein [Gammaproteobacteria bacterium]MDB9939899.1 DUF3108 domain-containing protein [Gammaproteobacteria bacterium]
MYKIIGTLLMVMAMWSHASDLTIPDYKAQYTFINSKVSMDGIRELKTLPNNRRSLSYNAKIPLGNINIRSEFHENENFISTDLYSMVAKVTLLKQKRVLEFNREEGILKSSGKFEWIKRLPKDLEIFDPLNAQVQIRKMVMQGAQEFSLVLPEMKTGDIKSNKYSLQEDRECRIGEKVYQCKVVQRYRPQEDRITTYFIAPDLNHMIVRMEDRDEDGDTLLQLQKIL